MRIPLFCRGGVARRRRAYPRAKALFRCEEEDAKAKALAYLEALKLWPASKHSLGIEFAKGIGAAFAAPICLIGMKSGFAKPSYFADLAVAKRLLISSQLTVFHQAAR
jgi:hypothetical protein